MFYFVSQNNSGGYFIENDDVAEYLVIEASNKCEFESKLYDIVQDYLEFCPCCGERWSTWMSDEGTEAPTIYREPVKEFLQSDSSYIDKEAIIYYLDGRKVKVSN